MEKSSKEFKSGYVAIAGAPNAGKSTLLNSLVHEKLAIVTPKPQTTRQKVLGIMNDPSYQIILLDSPGLLAPRDLMQEKMMEISRNVMEDADVILLLADSTKPEDDLTLVQNLPVRQGQSRLLVLNKTDISGIPGPDVLQEKAANYGCLESIAVSAKTGSGLPELVARILHYLPQGFPFYPPDQLSNEPERFFVSEIIREQIFLNYGEEIPYASGVRVVEFKERPGRKDFISALITVERDSQKAIVIGRDGQAIKLAGSKARAEIESFLGRPVYLELNVRVRKKWRKNPGMLRQMGFQ